ncbi:MAG: helix-turn-helix domain-containing protein [Paludisphaera borealis]|uniref:helix-turn-helix domain-containing protein n=1 Tax=Paludisphaera borealis TaxID=1387353 RepID=UPI0028415229|nr:helix-turn-helix domain-containing protein [Paludisphaera borealis]MDR3623317.1 helix-turn-helix domain-containing protein [Paludisphaera borealis]
MLADAARGDVRTDDDIVTALGASLKTIARVRRRFVVEGVDAAIDHRPQPQRPDKIKIKMNRQCLDRRLDSPSLMAEEVAAWEDDRNSRKRRIHWTFTLAVARQKLRKLYLSIEA